MKRLLASALMCVCAALSAQASDIYFSQTKGSDANPGTESQPLLSRAKAYSLWRPGDRVWERGFDFNIIARYDANDPYFGDKAVTPAPIPAPAQNADVIVSLKRVTAGYLTSVQFTRLKTNTSRVLKCVVDKDTTFLPPIVVTP